jgi:hypothetical protein
MTTIPTALRLARLGLAISLLGAGLLIASAQPGAADEIAPIPVSTTPSQTQSPAPATHEPTAATFPRDLCPLGMAGFGWG